jgi:hypothetical protein
MAARALIALFALAACAGPAPAVDHVAVVASPVPGHVRVTGTLTNHGGGGTVDLVITLHGPATLRTDQTIEVDAHQHVDLAIDVTAPAGLYKAEVRAEYPD